MSWTLVQYAKADNSSILAGASLTATFGSPTTAGNLLVAASCGWNGGVTAYTAPAGWVHKGTLQKDNNFATNDVSIYENNPGGITSVAVQQDTNGEAHLQLFEFNGNDVTAFDGITQNTVTSLSSFSRNSTTPTRSPDLVLTLINMQTTTITYTAGAESSGGSAQTKINDVSYFYEWDTITGLSPVTPTATFSASNNVAYSIIIFKAAPTKKTFPIVGSGTLVFNKLAVFPKLLAVVGSGLTSLVRKIKRNITLTGAAVTNLRAAKVRFKTLAATSSGLAKTLKRYPKKIAVVGTGISLINKLRMRAITVIGSGSTVLSKIRARIIHVTGSGILKFRPTILKNIKVIGTGFAAVLRLRFRTIAAASSGIIKLSRTRLRFIKVVGTQVTNMVHLRSIFILVTGTGFPTLKELQTHLIIIAALLTGHSVNFSKKLSKNIHTSGGGTIVIKVPRYLKKTIAVTGSKVLAFLKRTGTGTANGVQYNITSREEVVYNIKVEN